ncbi:uncharacterized protein Ubr3 isoform X1 [Maniola hyperantus]|uniref:uncharacterized protein Ubr3 isoform X1 n=1 Tax=Aphantopus hyperantus TaxID=2795564 RepID=UPI003748AF55
MNDNILFQHLSGDPEWESPEDERSEPRPASKAASLAAGSTALAVPSSLHVSHMNDNILFQHLSGDPEWESPEDERSEPRPASKAASLAAGSTALAVPSSLHVSHMNDNILFQHLSGDPEWESPEDERSEPRPASKAASLAAGSTALAVPSSLHVSHMNDNILFQHLSGDPEWESPEDERSEPRPASKAASLAAGSTALAVPSSLHVSHMNDNILFQHLSGDPEWESPEDERSEPRPASKAASLAAGSTALAVPSSLHVSHMNDNILFQHLSGDPEWESPEDERSEPRPASKAASLAAGSTALAVPSSLHVSHMNDNILFQHLSGDPEWESPEDERSEPRPASKAASLAAGSTALAVPSSLHVSHMNDNILFQHLSGDPEWESPEDERSEPRPASKAASLAAGSTALAVPSSLHVSHMNDNILFQHLSGDPEWESPEDERSEPRPASKAASLAAGSTALAVPSSLHVSHMNDNILFQHLSGDPEWESPEDERSEPRPASKAASLAAGSTALAVPSSLHVSHMNDNILFQHLSGDPEWESPEDERSEPRPASKAASLAAGSTALAVPSSLHVSHMNDNILFQHLSGDPEWESPEDERSEPRPASKAASLAAGSTALAVPSSLHVSHMNDNILFQHLSGDPEWESPEDERSEPRPASKAASLAAGSTALAVPSSLHMVRGNSVSDDQSDTGGDTPTIRALESGSGESQALVVPGLSGGVESDVEMEAEHMTLAIPETTLAQLGLDPPPVPITYEIDEPEWRLTIHEESPPRPALPAPQPSTDTQVQVHTQTDENIPVNESIISLLLKLHSQMSGRLDSFALEEPAPTSEEPIGDGPHFIGGLLHKLSAQDARCASSIQNVRRTLWPHQRERQAEQRARERREKEERSRRARDRQQQLMREFARRQQQFMSAMAMEVGDGAMEWDEEEEVVERDYDCVICNTTTPTTAQDPIGLVVLLQSTSVLGHRRRKGSGVAHLALSESERTRLASQQGATAAAHHYRLHDDLDQYFDQESWVLSVSVGWEGGVAAQSCGHHLHLHCLRSYLRSLAAPQRPHNLHVERGEFLCPVCRQLANGVLPLAPPPPRSAFPILPVPPTHQALAAQVLEVLERKREPAPAAPTRLSEATGKAMEAMTSMAGGKLKQRYGSSPAAIFTFMASLVRTNLECELVQRGGTLVEQPTPRYKPRDDCIVPLIAVVGAHAAALTSAGVQLGAGGTWRALIPPVAAAAPSGPAGSPALSPAGGSRPVPLLLRDPTALLMHFLLLGCTHPPHMDLQHFTCIVRVLYALTYYQVVNQLCATGVLPAAIEAQQADDSPWESNDTESGGLVAAAKLLLTALAGHHLLEDDASSTADQAPVLHNVELEVQELVVPYLRVAALLRKHIYGGELPPIRTEQEEFSSLLRYLELVEHDVPTVTGDSALWPGAANAAKAWARQLANASAGGQLAVQRVIRSLHVSWCGPALLALPRDYDRLFTYYHERVCLQCGAVPKEASVCLLCGTLVCLKQPCCRHHQVAEAVQHATECGGGTGIFLVVTSTYIIVIRGHRACLWGSLYLDDYDEEDRDLKRGKPLYLSQDRLELLQAQWLAHRFDHTKRTWVWHRDSL